MRPNEIFKILTEHCSEVIGDLENYEFNLSDRMEDLGANSMDRAEIITLTMESLSLKLPRIELAGAKTLGELAEVFSEKLQAA